MKHSRKVNLRYTLDGLRFDAAIDCDWTMRHYEEEEICNDITPIELYCFDHPEWDIYMVYHKERNDQQKKVSHKAYEITWTTCVDMDEILEETRKWIEEFKE